MSARVGVTGGTGFIAGALAKKVSEREGIEVRLFGRTEGIAANGAAVRRLNLSSAPFEGLDCVVHTAAITSSRAPAADLRAANVDLPIAVMRSAAASGVRRFVFLSSLHVHGKSALTPLTPESPLRPHNTYGASKAEAERLLRLEAEQLGIELVIVRPPMVYGTGSKGSFPLLLALVRIGLPLPFARAGAARTFCSIDNLVSALEATLHTPAPPPVLLPGDPEDGSTRTLIQLMGQALGRPARLFPFPIRVMAAALKAMGRAEMATSLFDSLSIDRRHWKDWAWSPTQTVADGVRCAISSAEESVKPTVLFVTNSTPYFFSHRIDLAREVIRRGFRVYVAGIDVEEHQALLSAEGIGAVPIKGGRRGIDPFGDFRGAIDLARTITAIKPVAVHATALKAIFLTALAGLFCRLPRVVCIITGLGSVYINDNRQARFTRALIEPVLRLLLRRANTKVVFQNGTDQDYFVERGICHKGNSFLIPGSGVDIDLFAYSEEPPTSEPLVIFPARLLVSKGVREFIAAASRLKAEGVKARFALIGDLDPANPDALSQAELEAVRADGSVEVHGFRKDMQNALAEAHVVCLPSYREGLPKSLIEAAAAGRPIVTTDVPGCRDVVTDRVNGRLVPARDPVALAEALGELVLNADVRRAYGRAGRARAEAEFAKDEINTATADLYLAP